MEFYVRFFDTYTQKNKSFVYVFLYTISPVDDLIYKFASHTESV